MNHMNSTSSPELQRPESESASPAPPATIPGGPQEDSQSKQSARKRTRDWRATVSPLSALAVGTGRRPFSTLISFRSVLPVFVLGIAILAFGVWANEYYGNTLLSLILREVGAVIMVVAVIHALYEVAIHRLLHSDITQLGETVERLQRTVSIVGGALESGLAAVFASRDEVNKAMTEEIERMGPNTRLRLLGISLGAFLCPHGALHGAFRRLLERSDITVEALILDTESDAALTRARLEEPHMFSGKEENRWREVYTVTRCHNELKTATDFAQDLADRCYLRDRNQSAQDVQGHYAPIEPVVKAKFSYRVSSTAPLCYIVMFEDNMFLENYHNAGRGGEAPVLKIARLRSESGEESRLFEIYRHHFEVMWQLGEDRSQRVQGGIAPSRGR